jgi:hypothetical protein
LLLLELRRLVATSQHDYCPQPFTAVFKNACCNCCSAHKLTRMCLAATFPNYVISFQKLLPLSPV